MQTMQEQLNELSATDQKTLLDLRLAQGAMIAESMEVVEDR